MNQRELAYRKSLIERMGGRWLSTIHVENRLNPGVPDLSYVMIGDGHETGWLELKTCAKPARVSARTPLKFDIEPSQHAWMTRHAHRVPTHFLIGVGDEHFLIDGGHHAAMSAGATLELLARLALVIITENEHFARTLAMSLSNLTRRDR